MYHKSYSTSGTRMYPSLISLLVLKFLILWCDFAVYYPWAFWLSWYFWIPIDSFFQMSLKHKFKTSAWEWSILPLTVLHFFTICITNSICSGCYQEWDHFCMGTHSIWKTRWKTMHMYRMKSWHLAQRLYSLIETFILGASAQMTSDMQLWREQHCSVGCLLSKDLKWMGK